MGFLDVGETLEWDKAKQHASYVKKHGVIQFLKQYEKVKGRNLDYLKWGDEIEYMVLKLDSSNPKKRTAKLCLRAADLLPLLQRDENENPETCSSAWRPEYGSFMLESTPGQPYGAAFTDILLVEPSMRYRRQLLQSILKKNEFAAQLTAFPLMGVGAFTEPEFPPRGYWANSYYVPDEVINPHPRFGTLTRNIRLRRGGNVNIRMPLFKDEKTQPIAPPSPPPRRPLAPNGEKVDEKDMPDIPLKDFGDGYEVHMDAMAFGMGCNCLQCTFQCCNVDEARTVYDQLAVISPLIMALTAASPIHRGYLVDTDVRWDVIAASVDDRHPEERGEEPLKEHPRVINKSRYGSIDSYLSRCPTLKPEFNDLDLIYDEEILQQLLEGGVDEILARHLAHLFIRDPLVIYDHKIELDDDKLTDHFENIQSTNWQNVRFKLPPPNSPIGWRVEFRTMELSLTDYENAAFAVFIQLMIRTINAMELDMYIPISKVDENMGKAHKRDAVRKEKFCFRENFNDSVGAPVYTMLTLNEIINGQGEGGFPGLIPIIQVFLDTTSMGNDVRDVVEEYLLLISKKASGELLTTASWMREFVHNHPDYKKDSIVTPSIAHDLVKKSVKISNGKITAPTLLGDISNRPPPSPTITPPGTSSLTAALAASDPPPSLTVSTPPHSALSASTPQNGRAISIPIPQEKRTGLYSSSLSGSFGMPSPSPVLSPFKGFEFTMSPSSSHWVWPTPTDPSEFPFKRAEEGETPLSFYFDGKRHARHSEEKGKEKEGNFEL